MKRVKIAILDTGLADEYDDPRICEKKQIFYNYDNEIVYVDGATDYNGHGTSCVDVILHYAESVELYILRFLDISGNARVDVFEKAMEIVEQKDVDIITVCASFIAEMDNEHIRNICKRISDKGKIIVAAVENGKQTSAIACYPEVIGVLGINCFNELEYVYEPVNNMMYCSSSPLVAMSTFGMRKTLTGNSKAAALATAIISNEMLTCRKEKISLAEQLQKNSIEWKKGEQVRENELYRMISFDKERELFFSDDVNYQTFLYLLAETVLCNDPDLLRTENLFEFKDYFLFLLVSEFCKYVENHMKVKIPNVIPTEDFQWAYLFYDKYVRGKKYE